MSATHYASADTRDHERQLLLIQLAEARALLSEALEELEAIERDPSRVLSRDLRRESLGTRIRQAVKR